MNIKIKANDQYVDRVLAYINELQKIADKGGFKNPGHCGFCEAAEDCASCPLFYHTAKSFVGCGDRNEHLTNRRGSPVNDYLRATPDSIRVRIRALIDRFNRYTDSKWKIEY